MQKSQVHVTFYMKAKEDKKASREAGRPIFKDVEYVQIRYPGDTKREHHAPAHERAYLPPDSGGQRISYAEMYPDHYKLFKAEAEQVVGTPLKELPFLTEAQRATLKAYGILSAEQFVGTPDRNLRNLGMGYHALRNQAKAYIEKATGNADTARLAAENAEMSDRLKAMEAMLAEMQKAKEVAA